MISCECREIHVPRRIVLTGGPGAGKTAVLELVRQNFCRHVDVLPEAATILFGGGFRRGTTAESRAATQRAIFHVQRELEMIAQLDGNDAVVLCDRGTVDGFAYWPDGGDYFASFGTTREQEMRRYDCVIHLRTPRADNGYDHSNVMRLETAAEAAVIDERIARAWDGHPRRYFVESTIDFLEKAHVALEILRAEMPACCREHQMPPLRSPPAGRAS